MNAFDQRMAELRLRFQDRAQRDLHEIEQALSHHDREALRRISHGLAGTAAIFGHADLGDAARRIEDAIDEQAGWSCLAELSDLLIADLRSIRTDPIDAAH